MAIDWLGNHSWATELDLRHLLHGEVLGGSLNISQELVKRKPLLWLNPKLDQTVKLNTEAMEQAKQDWEDYGPLLQEVFGVSVIDSPLKELASLDLPAALSHALKLDDDLPVAGSIKARGGFFEVLSHARELALNAGLITLNDSLKNVASHQDFFSDFALHVASTGNLGLSIGLMGRALGFTVFVHMSADAKQWKKDLLRSKGATVVEYDGDYSLAVSQGRTASEADPKAYFVDDERSLRLFWGYSKAAYDLKKQLPDDITPDKPLFVAIPCGVGGAPGGIAYGLKALYGDAVHLFFAEPIEAPAVLLGMATGLGEGIRVQDIGLTGQTIADGLAVGKPSSFVCQQMEQVLSGVFTVSDDALKAMQYALHKQEGIKVEPSASAGVFLPFALQTETGQNYLNQFGLELKDVRFVYWATGGNRVPDELYQEQLEEGKELLEEQPEIFNY